MRSFPIPAMAGVVVLLVGAMHDARASDAGESSPNAGRSAAVARASIPPVPESAGPPVVTGIGRPVPAEFLQFRIVLAPVRTPPAALRPSGAA